MRRRSTRWEPQTTPLVDWGLALAIFLVAFGILISTTEIGFPRDETFYFRAGRDYADWFQELWSNYQAGEIWTSLSKENIDRHWSYNNEHPVLMKTLFGLSDLLFHKYLGWFRPSTAMRIPGMLTGAGAVAVTYLFARRLFGQLAGIVAAGALFLQPRFFFHAHLACFDVPIAFFWLATIYAYWRSFDSNGWALATGLIWGLALCTKLNAFFLPIVVTGHWLATNWTAFGLRRTEAGWSISWPPMPRALVSMALLGPLTFYALTPRFWFDTFRRFAKYLAFHMEHVHYFVVYYGENLKNPPFPIDYPWVMTALTVPAVILLAASLGMVEAGLKWDPIDWAKRWWHSAENRETPARDAGDPRGTGLLILINLLFPIALISLPSTPIFGGTKHWMPAMPFLAMFAGAGTTLASRLVRRRLADRDEGTAKNRVVSTIAALVLSTSVLGPAAYATADIHPFGTSYYNGLIGSIRGAADHQMFRQFWGYASRQGLPWLNEHAESNAPVWTHNATGYAWWHYQNENLLRGDLDSSGFRRADYAVFHHQKAFVKRHAQLWLEYETKTPAHVVSKEGVPLVSIYRRPRLLPSSLGGQND